MVIVYCDMDDCHWIESGQCTKDALDIIHYNPASDDLPVCNSYERR